MGFDRIVGLDLSLTATGFYVFDEDRENGGLLDTGKLAGIERVDSILEQVHNIADCPRGLVVIEDFSFASRGRAVFDIGGLGWLVRHQLWKAKIKFWLVAPTALKKFITGTGNAQKSLILKEVYKRYTKDFTDDNVADAYALARIGRAIAGWDSGFTQFQEDVLNKLKGQFQ